MKQNTRLKSNVDCFILFLYALLTVFFFIDRTTFLDNAFQTFLLIQEGDLILNANRWPAVSVQFLPLLGVKLGLGLKSILFLFSTSYFLFHALIFLVVRLYLNDKTNAWLLLSLMIIPVAHSFYWCNSELILGLSAMCLWVSFFEKRKMLGAILMASILPWFHPLLICCFLFVTVYYFLMAGEKRSGISLIVFLSSAFVKSQFFSSWYDNNKKADFLSKLEAYQVSDLSNIFSFLNLQNAPVFLSLALALALCLFRKKILTVLMLVVFSLLYLFIADVSTTRYHFQFYIEVNMLSIFFISAFIVKNEIKTLKVSNVIYPIFIGLLLLGLVRIGMTSNVYKERQDQITELSNTFDRAIVEYDEAQHGWMLEYWASPYESLILSTLNGPSKTFLFHLDPKNFLKTKKDQHFLTYFRDYPFENINQDYFQLPNQAYQTKQN